MSRNEMAEEARRPQSRGRVREPRTSGPSVVGGESVTPGGTGPHVDQPSPVQISRSRSGDSIDFVEGRLSVKRYIEKGSQLTVEGGPVQAPESSRFSTELLLGAAAGTVYLVAALLLVNMNQEVPALIALVAMISTIVFSIIAKSRV